LDGRKVEMKSRFLTFTLTVLLAPAAAVAQEKSTPDEAKALLDKAVAEVQKEGSAMAIAKFNDPKGGYQQDDLYVFCMDSSNKVSAHPEASQRGLDVATMKDSNGKAFGAEMVAAAKKGSGTVEYIWKNPESGKVEAKVSYLKKAGDQICGVGAYK
jgi:cytochrome c